jgi:hypothetical protein
VLLIYGIGRSDAETELEGEKVKYEQIQSEIKEAN